MSLYKNKKIKWDEFSIKFEEEIKEASRRKVSFFFIHVPDNKYSFVEEYCNKYNYRIEVSHETEGKIYYKVSL